MLVIDVPLSPVASSTHIQILGQRWWGSQWLSLPQLVAWTTTCKCGRSTCPRNWAELEAAYYSSRRNFKVGTSRFTSKRFEEGACWRVSSSKASEATVVLRWASTIHTAPMPILVVDSLVSFCWSYGRYMGSPASGDRELSCGAVLRRFSSWAEGFIRIKWWALHIKLGYEFA